MTRYASFLTPDRFTIFLFHGVIRVERWQVRNYTRKHLPLDEFVAILRELLDAGYPVSMDDVVAASRGGTALPERAFALTFDDGFANNATVAAPILADLRAPAMFYVTTQFVAENRPSWTDLIEYAVERLGTCKLVIPDAGIAGTYRTAEEKTTLLDAIRRYVRGNRGLDPYAFAETLIRMLGVETFEPDPDLDEKLSWDQVRALDREPGFSVGGHGHSHRILEFLDDVSLIHEIRTSVSLLRQQLGHPIGHYSYPEGLAHCYSDRVITLLKRQGIVCVPSAVEGTNRVGDDLFHLRRVMVA